MIEVERLGRSFNNKKILTNINFQAHEGEVICLSGKNGAGKTTLLRILATLIRPSHGNIRVTDLDLQANQKKLRQHIAFLSANEQSFFPRLTGIENILLLSSFYQIEHKFVHEQLTEWKDLLPLEESLRTPFGQCSSGMKQLVRFAFIMLRNCKLILLDEPLRGLDPENRLGAIKILKRWHRHGVILFTDHGHPELREVATRSFHLQGGELK